MQSRKHSIIESCTNIIIGYFVALGSQLVIFPAFGVHVSFKTNLWIGAWFTLVSLVRSYIVRRAFNKLGRHLARKRQTEAKRKWVGNIVETPRIYLYFKEKGLLK